MWVLRLSEGTTPVLCLYVASLFSLGKSRTATQTQAVAVLSPGLSTLNRKQLPRPRNTPEVAFAAFGELDSGAHDEVLHGSGNERFT